MAELKEKGNACFKLGQYPEAIGHYSAAIVADRNEHTYYLNRAAAYLKLGKYEDAARDCNTVLTLSKSNTKAIFRRAQARIGLNQLEEAETDLKELLRLDPNNESAKSELLGLKEKQQKRPPRRKRIPIEIIEPSSSSTETELLKPISSRSLSSSSSEPPIPPPTPAAVPKPTSFSDAKKVREGAKPSRVGGGIFRSTGSHTVFKAKDDQDAASGDKPPEKEAPALLKSNHKAPMSLFDFTRAWESSTDIDRRWYLISGIPGSSLPGMFQTSLEASLLASLLQVFLVALTRKPSSDDTTKDVLSWMQGLPAAPRFSTVRMFLSSEEKLTAGKVLDALGTDSADLYSTWGFKK